MLDRLSRESFFAIVGQIGTGGTIFEVGTQAIFQAQTGGELYLLINDNFLGDNSGSWTATITVAPGPNWIH